MKPEQTAILTCVLALACTPKSPSDETEQQREQAVAVPAPIEPAAKVDDPSVPVVVPEPEPDAGPAADEAVLVRQIAIGPPKTWRFEPGGLGVAAIYDGKCGVWRRDGAFLRTVAGGAEAPPCATWLPLEPFPWVKGPIAITKDKLRLVVEGKGFVVEGSSLRGEASEGRTPRAAAFSPDGARFALFTIDEDDGQRGDMRIEIWDIAGARLERELVFEDLGVSFTPDSLTARRFWLGWTERSLSAVVDLASCDRGARGCDPLGRVWIQSWPALDGPAVVHQLQDDEEEFGESVEALFIDPDHRSVFANVEGRIPDDGRHAHEFVGAWLSEADPLDLSYWSTDEDEDDAEPVPAQPLVPLDPWNDLVGASRVSLSVHDGNGYEFELGTNWSLLSLVDLPDRTIQLAETSGFVHYSRLEEKQALKLVLAARDKLVSEITFCPEGTEESEDGPKCEHANVVPEGCTVIDGSWSVDKLLLTCGDRWMRAATPELGTAIDLASAFELGVGTDAPHRVVWGAQGLAIWTKDTGLRMFVGDRLAGSHAEISELHRAVLDEALDLALVRQAEGVRVAKLASGELGPVLAWTGPVEFAAFAPDGGRIALAGGGELAVFSTEVAEPIGRWPRGPLMGLAFRQDGAVLHLGVTRPTIEVAIDPVTGADRSAKELDPLMLERLAEAVLDPSWRWAIERDDTLLRTLDGQAIHLIDDETAIAESGWFMGKPERFYDQKIRIGPDPLAPVFTVAELAGQLERANLVVEFVSGRALPRPHVHPPG